MKKYFLLLSCAVLALLLSGKTFASCAPQRGYAAFNSNLFLGTVSVRSDATVGASVDGITHSIDNTGGAGPNWYYYMMYCASGSALMWLTVTSGSSSIGTNNAFNTNIEGIGVSITFRAPFVSVSGNQSASIGPCTLTKISGYSCPLSAMTFYFHQGFYDVQVIKTGTRTGVGNLNQITVKNAGNGSSTDLGVLNINGTISASGCTLSESDKNLDIPLGSYPVTRFTGLGATTDAVEVPVTLNCPTIGTAVKLTATSNGGALDAPNGVIKLSNGSTATGLGVQLLKSDATSALPLNTSVTLGNSTAAVTTFKLYARYLQTSSTVTSGTANAMATFTLNYQ